MILIQRALCTIKDELLTTGYFTKFYEYAERIEKIENGVKKFPQTYIGQGNYTQIYDFDVNGSGYIRKNGEVRAYKLDDKESCGGLNPTIDLIVPLRLIAGIPKKNAGDNSFSDDLIALDLLSYIGKKQPAIDQVQSVIGNVSGYQTDRDTIWSEEVKGIEKQLRLDLSLIAIDFTLTFRATLECIKNNCTY